MYHVGLNTILPCLPDQRNSLRMLRIQRRDLKGPWGGGEGREMRGESNQPFDGIIEARHPFPHQDPEFIPLVRRKKLHAWGKIFLCDSLMGPLHCQQSPTLTIMPSGTGIGVAPSPLPLRDFQKCCPLHADCSYNQITERYSSVFLAVLPALSAYKVDRNDLQVSWMSQIPYERKFDKKRDGPAPAKKKTEGIEGVIFPTYDPHLQSTPSQNQITCVISTWNDVSNKLNKWDKNTVRGPNNIGFMIPLSNSIQKCEGLTHTVDTMVDVGGKIFQEFEHVNYNERTHLSRSQYVLGVEIQHRCMVHMSYGSIGLRCYGPLDGFIGAEHRGKDESRNEREFAREEKYM
ncbi:hypothetical protein DFH07DRAFT_782257 [Mycena maculata]|uniref:Uncharacterized protein n=1 Tax=Mycena maculata TaxID=230809 RepID=A0AAD7HVL6_9AGAR|nr:hypothetical protein DFH07DRAFT_782257 [Mycena maculata]